MLLSAAAPPCCYSCCSHSCYVCCSCCSCCVCFSCCSAGSLLFSVPHVGGDVDPAPLTVPAAPAACCPSFCHGCGVAPACTCPAAVLILHASALTLLVALPTTVVVLPLLLLLLLPFYLYIFLRMSAGHHYVFSHALVVLISCNHDNFKRHPRLFIFKYVSTSFNAHA